MTSKITDYYNQYVVYQLELVDKLEQTALSLNPKIEKEAALAITMWGHIYNIFYRLKGIKDLLKFLHDHDLVIPVKYDKYLKGIKEPFYLKGQDVFDESDTNLKDLVNYLKQ